VSNARLSNRESAEVQDGPYFDQSIPASSPGMKTSASTKFANSFKSAEPKSKSFSTSQKKFKSKMGQDQMEAVIKEIKSRFGEHKIQEMSSQEL